MPQEWGAAIEWVEQLEGSRTLIRVAGIELIGTADRVTCRIPDVAAIEPMLAYAAERGWTVLTVSGGTAEWRAAAIIAAETSGFRIEGAVPKAVSVRPSDPGDEAASPVWS
jgi:hypothetical protein